MALGDGIRRNIASVDPAERVLFRNALVELNDRLFPGNRNDPIPGGVSWWFKQDETHQATHVHQGPEFVPWHREIVNRLEVLLREINPKLSLHYWDWTQDPRNIPNANLGGGTTGPLNLFTSQFMGFGGANSASIGQPWFGAGYYVPSANLHRDSSGNPADPPKNVVRNVSGSPASVSADNDIVNAATYSEMRSKLELVHGQMHGFVNMGDQHVSFRDPFVFLLHSNVDRLYAKWQTQPGHPERLDPAKVYGSESNLDVLVDGHIQNLTHNVEPWSGGLFTRPWAAPENHDVTHNYKHPFIVIPPHYDTNGTALPPVHLNAALFSGTMCYFFAGNQYIRVTRGDTGAGTVDAGYPKKISPNWGWGNFGKKGIDASLNSGPKCYFFSGDEYIRVTRDDTGPGTVDAGYPKKIFPNWGWGNFGKKGIDAALYSGTKCYFFAGDQYIRVTRGNTGPGTVDVGYPKKISPSWGWGNFGKKGIEAALHSGPKCYFFSGNRYIRVTRGDTGPGTVDPGYPKRISLNWEWPGSFFDLWVMMSIFLRD